MRASATRRARHGAATTAWAPRATTLPSTSRRRARTAPRAAVSVNDAARPSDTQSVNDAVAQCRQETNGSEYDMALWLHDWALDQLEYDHSLNWCSAESGLTRHHGTCESYQRIYLS